MKVPALLKEGDVVVVHATVRFDDDPADLGDVHLIPVGASHHRFVIPRELVVGFVRREWKVGDLVHDVNDRSDRGEVVAAMEGMAWVKLESGAFVTYAGLDLEPAPAPDFSEVDANPQAEVDPVREKWPLEDELLPTPPPAPGLRAAKEEPF